MRLLTLGSLILFVAGCGETEYVALQPEIQAETLRPCPLVAQSAITVNELAALAIENRKTAECANSKIEAIADIVRSK